MLKRKVGRKYFDKDYWRAGTKSGYTSSNYFRGNYLDTAKGQLLIELYGSGNCRWLEAGCAFGWTTEYLIQSGEDVYGFDISKYSIENCPEEISDRFLCHDGLDEEKYAKESYDIIFSFETAEHIYESDADTWISNLCAWLKPGGNLFLTICTGLNNFRGADDIDESHQTLKPREWWEQKIEFYGMSKDMAVFNKAHLLDIHTDKMKALCYEPENIVKRYNWHLFTYTKNANRLEK